MWKSCLELGDMDCELLKWEMKRKERRIGEKRKKVKRVCGTSRWTVSLIFQSWSFCDSGGTCVGF